MGRKEKKGIVYLIIIFVFLILIIPVSVAISQDHIYQKKQSIKTPFDYPGSTWTSAEPDIVLRISDVSKVPDDSECYIVLNEERLDVIFYPGYPNLSYVVLRNYSSNEDPVLLICSCKFSEKSVEMRVKNDYVFDGQYRTITLKHLP